MSLLTSICKLAGPETIKEYLERNPDSIYKITSVDEFAIFANFIEIEKIDYTNRSGFFAIVVCYLSKNKLDRKFNPNFCLKNVFWHLIVDKLMTTYYSEFEIINNFLVDKLENFSEPINPNVQDSFGRTYLYKNQVGRWVFYTLGINPLLQDKEGLTATEFRAKNPIDSTQDQLVREYTLGYETKLKLQDQSQNLKLNKEVDSKVDSKVDSLVETKEVEKETTFKKFLFSQTDKVLDVTIELSNGDKHYYVIECSDGIIRTFKS